MLSFEAPANDTAPVSGRQDSIPFDFVDVAEQAAVWSGGIPCIFLQLLADAGTYARMRRGDAWPTEADLGDALADLKDSFRRALLPGDDKACRAAEGTDGRELDVQRKIRLLSRGLLLERRDNHHSVIEIHPIAKVTLMESPVHA